MVVVVVVSFQCFDAVGWAQEGHPACKTLKAQTDIICLVLFRRNAKYKKWICGYSQAGPSAIHLTLNTGRGWTHSIALNTARCSNKVTLCQAQLVLGWVSICRRVYHLGM